MAKTTLPSKQLELPIMIDLNQRVDRQVVAVRGATDGSTPLQVAIPRQVEAATATDLSIYDAISSNYVR